MTQKESIKVLENLGYVVNLWHISEVTDYYKCSKAEAAVIIDEVFDELEEQIFDRVHDEASDRGLELYE